MALKHVAVVFAAFGLMAQHSPSQPDGPLNEQYCLNIAAVCIDNYQARGYSTPNSCFDDITQGNCPVPDNTYGITRSWEYYEYVIQFCYGHC